MRESSLLNEDPKQLCCATKMCKRLIMGQHPNAFFWGLPLILAGMQLSVTAASQSTCYIKSSMHPFFLQLQPNSRSPRPPNRWTFWWNGLLVNICP